MEKLQAALNKARETRTTGDARMPSGSSKKAGGPIGLDDLWQELEPFEVQDDHLEMHRVVTRAANPAATPFDILRTKVLLQMRQNGWKRLAITSPMPQSGKTTTSCNLALGLGRQKDLRAILLDLDLRDPSVSSFLRADPKHSIGDVLSGKVAFADQALRIGDNVACSMANRQEKDPTQLLLAEETAAVIDQIESSYQPDVMIFDLPSMLVNDDTRAFLKNIDCALLVIRADYTKYGQFDNCEREVAEQTNVLGAVLNAYAHKSDQKD